MGRIDATLLDVDDLFPGLDLQLTNGEILKLPGGTEEGYSVLLLYRGYW